MLPDGRLVPPLKPRAPGIPPRFTVAFGGRGTLRIAGFPPRLFIAIPLRVATVPRLFAPIPRLAIAPLRPLFSAADGLPLKPRDAMAVPPRVAGLSRATVGREIAREGGVTAARPIARAPTRLAAVGRSCVLTLRAFIGCCRNAFRCWPVKFNRLPRTGSPFCSVRPFVATRPRLKLAKCVL